MRTQTIKDFIHRHQELFWYSPDDKAQLAYHEDIDYGEAVEFLPGHAVGEEEIRAFLMEVAV